MVVSHVHPDHVEQRTLTANSQVACHRHKTEHHWYRGFSGAIAILPIFTVARWVAKRQRKKGAEIVSLS